MIPKECKRLAEVDFPIAEVSKHAVREKSIHHGHPSTLHLWWARRPLASSRAMLMALLLPDPCDSYCPGDFKEKARNLLPPLCGSVGNTDYDLQRKLFHFIADFANWDNAHKKEYLELSRALIQAAHPEETPLVVDPFSGGGSIPLEALRIGCDAFASDLNPVAYLILKTMLEEIPTSSPDIIDELRAIGDEIINRAQEELRGYYPDDPDGSKPVAYIWARTVHCESPNCGAEIPLMRSFWLCNKPNKKVALRPIIIRKEHEIPCIEFDIFEPHKDSEVYSPTVSRAKATCLCCGSVLPPERVRSQLAEQNGGVNVIFDKDGKRIGGAKILAIALMNEGEKERKYRQSTLKDYVPVSWATQELKRLDDEWERNMKNRLSPFPNEPTPRGGGSGAGRAFSIQKYGITQLKDLFTNRQLITLHCLSSIIRRFDNSVSKLFLGKILRHLNTLAKWHRSSETVAGAFGLNAMSTSWDYPEMMPFCSFAGSLKDSISEVISAVEIIVKTANNKGIVSLSDAVSHPLSDDAASCFFSDPPYYDAIPYSDLSDFFLVWIKRMNATDSMLIDPYDKTNVLSNKDREIVQDDTRYLNSIVKDKAFFELQMGKAFSEGKRILEENGIASIVFAHKTTEGWEALLSGIIEGGFTITSSWPIATERTARLRAYDSAALATSIHLVCRPRPENAGTGDWATVLQELPDKVGKWMDRLEAEGVRGADLVFSCIGPALEIFSRYNRVETAAGEEISIGKYLEKVWEVVGRIALEQILGSAESLARNGAAGALEEDARLTALFLWTLQSTDGEAVQAKDRITNDSDDEDEDSPKQVKAKSGFSLVYDVARRFAQPLGIDLAKWDKRIIDIDKGSVRLIPVSERAKSLFGSDRLARAERNFAQDDQIDIFEDYNPAPSVKLKGKKQKSEHSEEGAVAMVTTLDKVHAAMILQDMGHTNTLRALIKSEMEQGQDFQRLANSLSALYPKGSKEKRLVDAMLLSVRSVS